MPNFRSLSLGLLILAVQATAARAETPRGTYAYANLEQCRDGDRLGEALCTNAAANAEAEFDEKAPRFRTRKECEARFRAGRCELGIAGASGWSGQKQGIFFMPQQSGFQVTVRSQTDMTVLPSMRGDDLGFAPRSILKLQTSRSTRLRREAGQVRGRGVAFGQPTGVEAPSGEAGPLPPPPVVDPNFDCSSLLEPSPGQPASSGCYPVPAARLRR
jgi:uncharacterized protein YgiB involved in biofilm formation